MTLPDPSVPDWEKDAAAQVDTERWRQEADQQHHHDAVAMQMCMAAGLDADTAHSLIWRLRNWLTPQPTTFTQPCPLATAND